MVLGGARQEKNDEKRRKTPREARQKEARKGGAVPSTGDRSIRTRWGKENLPNEQTSFTEKKKNRGGSTWDKKKFPGILSWLVPRDVDGKKKNQKRDGKKRDPEKKLNLYVNERKSRNSARQIPGTQRDFLEGKKKRGTRKNKGIVQQKK